MPVDLVFIMGAPGSGKTTVLREWIESKNMVSYESKDKKVAWVSDGYCVVFGRWTGLHKTGASKIAGRLDGCDRLWNGAANLCVASDLMILYRTERWQR